MVWKAIIEKITPIGEVGIGTWDTKEDAEKEMYYELGLHWNRYLEPDKNVIVVLKLKEVL